MSGWRGRGAVKLFLIQLRSELKKLFARRRTYIGYGAFLVLELVILWVFHLDGPREEIAKILSDTGKASYFPTAPPSEDRIPWFGAARPAPHPSGSFRRCGALSAQLATNGAV